MEIYEQRIKIYELSMFQINNFMKNRNISTISNLINIAEKYLVHKELHNLSNNKNKIHDNLNTDICVTNKELENFSGWSEFNNSVNNSTDSNKIEEKSSNVNRFKLIVKKRY